LWTPTPIALGSVGYLSKPSGQFVTLLNMFDPSKSSDGIVQGMPSVHGYGRVAQESLRQDKRNAALRSLDKISGFLTFGGKNSVSYVFAEII
jgi:abelson tyrosine-protein kinase 1